MPVSLREDRTFQPASTGKIRVDRDKGIAFDLKFSGLTSLNGRDYDLAAYRDAKELYEGAKSNIDHPAPGQESRSFHERFGRCKNVRITDEGVRGDYHFNPKHPLAESFVWWCENDPSAVGFSHNAEGELSEGGGRPRVTKITKVHSVDLVADGATVNGLQEHQTMNTSLRKLTEGRGDAWAAVLREMDAALADAPLDAPADGDDWKTHLTNAIGALVKSDDPDSHKIARKILNLLKTKGADMPQDGDTMESIKRKLAELTEARDNLSREKSVLLAEVDAFKVKETHAAKLTEARKLCAEAKLPDYAVTDHFVGELAQKADAAAMKALIEDRRVILAGANRPISSGQGGTGDVTFEQFLESVGR